MLTSFKVQLLELKEARSHASLQNGSFLILKFSLDSIKEKFF